MSESKSLTLTEFAEDLESLPAVSARLMLTKIESDSGGWIMRAAAMKVAPDVPMAGWTLYDYGPVAFVAASTPGSEVARWFIERRGEAAGLHFEVPEVQEQVRAERLSSHARYRFFAGLWQPHTHYELSPKSDYFEPPRDRNPLIQDGCPSLSQHAS